MTALRTAEPLSPGDFAAFSRFLEKRSAISLTAGKEYLVETRLSPIVRELGMESVGALVRGLETRPDQALSKRVVDAMTTNETLWFRDITPWTALEDVILPEIIKRKGADRSLNIWCGAASSGQESYTVSMLLEDNFPELSTWRKSFVGTDINEKMLQRCRDGNYSALEVNRGLPAAMLVRHFEREGATFRVKESLRRSWTFKPLNLAEPFPPLPRADIVLLRNVLIYFNDAVKADVLRRIRSVMHPDGWLMLGSAESPLALDDGFERVTVGRTTAYRIRGHA